MIRQWIAKERDNVKNILITGADSYVGTSVEKWLAERNGEYHIDTLDMRDDKWKLFDFSVYDTVFHVAGIAHVSTDPSMETLYYKVNRDLTIETAKMAKLAGVKQFIFMSSGIVYGNSSDFGKDMMITKDTVPNPENFYGKSKIQAEEGIEKLRDVSFKVVILRPPMIYGPGCKGNYNQLAKFGKKLPLFPKVNNRRSMLFITNLCEFVRLMIDNNEDGLFFPSNEGYISTGDMVGMIAESNGRKIHMTRFFNPLLLLLSKFMRIVNKAFGSFAYDSKMTAYKENYRMFDFYESIKKTESERTNDDKSKL